MTTPSSNTRLQLDHTTGYSAWFTTGHTDHNDRMSVRVPHDEWVRLGKSTVLDVTLQTVAAVEVVA